MRNPTLMLALGFKLRSNAGGRSDSNLYLSYPVPSAMQPARTGAVTGAVAGGLSRPLDGALSLNLLKVAAAVHLPRVKFGATQKLNESCRHCELNMLRSK